MNKLHYKIEFFTDWHCGSGLAAGADVDALVVKDSQNLPFVPGKTIKGLLREAMEDLLDFQGVTDKSCLVPIFGNCTEQESRTDNKSEKGNYFFSNAELPAGEKQAIVAGDMSKYLYRSISSTAIDNNGIAKNHSLRKMQVTVPCILEGDIIAPEMSEGDITMIEKGMKMIKRLGQNRNRGLGRCQFTIVEKGVQA